MLDRPSIWLEVRLREDTLIVHDLTWRVRIWRRPDIQPHTLAKLVILATQVPGIAGHGNEHEQVAAGLFETYGFYVEFRPQQTIH